MDGASRSGVPVTSPDSIRGTPEVIVTDRNVVDGVISHGELHSVAVVSAPDDVAGIEDVEYRCMNRVSDQPIVAIRAYPLVDIVVNDLTRVRVENMNAIELIISAAGRYLGVAVRDAKARTSHDSDGVCERVTSEYIANYNVL
jgi:hypothetical protein